MVADYEQLMHWIIDNYGPEYAPCTTCGYNPY